MSVPAFEKTWQYALNGTVPGSSSSWKTALLQIKNALVGFDDSPWEVLYSCDGVTAGSAGDLVDRWVDEGDLVHTNLDSSAHSWMVLKQPGLMSNFQLLINFIGTGTTQHYNANIYVSPTAGFTGGTTTARPTATDEGEITPVANWGTSVGSTVGLRTHVWLSDDGQCTRVVVMQNEFSSSVWIIDRLKTDRAGVTEPFCAVVLGATNASTHVISRANFNDTANCKVRVSTTYGDAYLTCEGCNGGSLAGILYSFDDIDGSYVLCPMGVFSNTASAKGRYGVLYDLWWGALNSVNSDSFPETYSKATGQLGRWVFPAGGVLLAGG